MYSIRFGGQALHSNYPFLDHISRHDIAFVTIDLSSESKGFLIVENPFNNRKISIGDQTLLKQYANNLVPALHKENLTESFKNFAAQAGHELRNSLQSIQSYSKLINLKSQDKINVWNHRIGSQAKYSEITVTNLIDYVKSERPEWPLELEEFLIDELIKHSIESMEAAAWKEDIVIQPYNANPGLTMTGDIHKLQMVICNCLNNSIKALSKDFDEARRTILIQVKEIEARKIEIRIVDKGFGIPKANLENLFKLFIGKRTGLGLHLAKKIIDKHKGDIKIESEIDKGTTIIITLPKGGKI